MSSPATAAFLASWRKYDSARRTLAVIDLGAIVLHYATGSCFVGTQFYQGGLQCDSIREAVAMLDPGLSPASATIRLLKRDALQSDGDHIAKLLHSYVAQSATVTLYLWVDGDTTLGSSDAFQVFSGKITRAVDISPDGMTLVLMQDMSWNKQTPPVVVDKVSYPNSPDVSQGLPIPIIYGDHKIPPMRSPWATSYGSKAAQDKSGGGEGVVPLVLVDAGIGNAKVKLVAAGHLLADLYDDTTGHNAYIVGERTLNPLDTTGMVETLGASASYLELADENTIAYAAAIPIDVRVAAGCNTAANPRRAMDVFDETSYATLDQGAAQSVLQLILPNLGALGRIELVQYFVAYSGDPANANNLRIRSCDPAGGPSFGATTANWAAASATPSIQTGTWAAGDWTQNWDFGSGGTAHAWDVRIDFVGGAANKAHIYWVALVVKYRPQRSLVTPGGVTNVRDTRIRPGNPPVGGRPIYLPRITPAQFQLDGQFYSCPKGYADDGGGTYTGAAGALIERPCDIAQHFLVTYGGVSGGSISTGATDPGSFVLARSTLRNAGPSGLKLAAWIGERTTVQRVLQNIAAQSGMCIYQDRFTGNWVCFVWKAGATVDYDHTFSWDRDDLADFRCEETSVVDVTHAIRVKYGFDHYKGRTLFEAFVNSAGSSQGFNLPTQRDQKLTITAGVNNALDWTQVAVGTFSITLGASTYAPIDLAEVCRIGMRTVLGTNLIDVAFGFSIKAGYNNKIDFDVAAVNYVATLTAGDYTAEALAVEVIRVVNAAAASAGITFTLTAGSYDHTTNTFSFTGSAAFSFDGSSGAANFATTAVHVLGDINHPAAATTWGSTFARYGDRFWFGGVGLINMLWGSGVNAATNAAAVLGYDKTDSGNSRDNPAIYRRGQRETTATTYEGYYGPHEERQITADWIRDEATAVELRDKIFDLTARPRVVVRFKSLRCPDIRRMQVIQFDNSLDAVVPYPKYGSDGSWTGKPFVVLEVEQSLGPEFHTDVLAIEAA